MIHQWCWGKPSDMDQKRQEQGCYKTLQKENPETPPKLSEWWLLVILPEPGFSGIHQQEYGKLDEPSLCFYHGLVQLQDKII